MKKIVQKLVLLAAFCVLAQLAFAHKDVEPKNDTEAANWIEDALRSFSNVKVTDVYVLYRSGTHDYSILLARTSNVFFGEEKRSSYPYCVQWRDYARDGPDHICWGYRRHKESERFAAALEYLSTEAKQKSQSATDADWAHFQQQLKPWREAAEKPAMPEAAREHQVLAEYAFKQKDTDKAMAEYAKALAIFSTWSEGQFNLATLCGEAKHYQCAVLHMKEYLELATDSPDAQAAKDSVIIWKDKLSAFQAVAVQDARAAQH